MSVVLVIRLLFGVIPRTLKRLFLTWMIIALITFATTFQALKFWRTFPDVMLLVPSFIRLRMVCKSKTQVT